MKDFLVHLYIEEHCFTDTLSALYERSKDLVLSVREVSYRLFLPVFVEDGQFVIEERKQAKLLNMIMEQDFFKFDNELFQKRLKEFVGHTPLQVAAGAVLGIVLAIGMEYLYV